MDGTIKPIRDNVIVKPIPPEALSPGGLFIPDAAREELPIGMVIGVGPGKVVPGVGLVVPEVKVGDMVAYRKHAGVEITLGTTRLRVLMEAEVICVLDIEETSINNKPYLKLVK